LNTEEGKPRFELKIELRLARLDGNINVQDPALITDKILDQVWNTMNDFVIDMLDAQGIEPTDEHFREIFVEICYRIIYREMFTLLIAPHWEQSDLERLGTRKTGARVRKKGSYDDTWRPYDE
jgi:hypothetical protein